MTHRIQDSGNDTQTEVSPERPATADGPDVSTRDEALEQPTKTSSDLCSTKASPDAKTESQGEAATLSDADAETEAEAGREPHFDGPVDEDDLPTEFDAVPAPTCSESPRSPGPGPSLGAATALATGSGRLSTSNSTVNIAPNMLRSDGSGEIDQAVLLDEEYKRILDPEALIGQRLGNWELRALIGRGAMGAVYRAQTETGAGAAVKVILPGLPNAARYLPRFRQEAAVTGSLDHPGIVRFLDYEESPIPHLVLAYVDGETLRQRLRTERKFSARDALEIACKLFEALDHAHALGAVHRDLKPENILVTATGRPVITDYGLGRIQDEGGRARLTHTGQVMGTPFYMAPEQFESVKEVGPAADLYSLGVILFHMLAGQPPFRGSQAEIVLAHVSGTVPDLRSWVPELPTIASACVAKLLAKDPEERYAGAKEVLPELRAALAELNLASGSEELVECGLEEGSLVGEWTVGGLIGRGGMGTVYRAQKGEESCALKVLELGATTTSLQRFEREALIMKELNHPNIVPIFDHGVTSGAAGRYPYIAMELFSTDLGQLVEERGPLSPVEAATAAIAAAEALSAAHRSAVVHRDVKPDNLFLRGEVVDRESVCLGDFGVAALSQKNARLTQTSGAVGSPYYMAPEQARGDEAGPKADLYSLGATLFFLLTASRPFAADKIEGLLLAHARTLPPRADQRSPEVPEDLGLLVDFALLKVPADRPSIEEFSADLEAWLERRLSPIRRREIRARVKAGRGRFQSRMGLASKLTILIAVVAITISLFSLSRDGSDPFRTSRELAAITARDFQRGVAEPAQLIALLDGLQRARETADLAAQKLAVAVPPELRMSLDQLQEKLEAASLADAEGILARRLAGKTPLGPRLDSDRRNIKALLAPIRKSGERTWRAPLKPRLRDLDRQLQCLGVARRLMTKLAVADKQTKAGAYEIAIPALEEAVQARNEFVSNYGRLNPVVASLRDELGRGDRAQAHARSALGELQERLAPLVRVCEKSLAAKDEVRLTGAKAKVDAFLQALPSGNPELEARARKLLVLSVNLDIEKARARLAAAKGQIREQPGSYAAHEQTLVAMLRDYPAKLYPEIQGGIVELQRQLVSDRDRAAARSFAGLVDGQNARLKGLLGPKDFELMDRVVKDFAARGPLAGWSSREDQVEGRRRRLRAIRADFGARLLRRAEQRILRRRAGEGHGAFCAKIDAILKLVSRAVSYPGHDAELAAWLRSSARWLRIRQDSTHLRALPGGAIVIGRNAPGFPHNPAHREQLAPYFLDRFEVSVDDYRRFLDFVARVGPDRLHWLPPARSDPPYRPQAWNRQLRRPRLPVVGLTRDDAAAFALFVGKRLPTEAEWEAAARRGHGQESGPYAWGSAKLSPKRCRFMGPKRLSGPLPVDAALAGETRDGIRHLSGNVAEWTASMLSVYPGGDPHFDLAGVPSPAAAVVIRGGSFSSEALELAVWRRDALAPLQSRPDLGFRCAARP